MIKRLMKLRNNILISDAKGRDVCRKIVRLERRDNLGRDLRLVTGVSTSRLFVI